mgnify:FL=1
MIWFLFATPYYELRISKRRKTWQGEQTLSDRVVVLVIYPSDGLPDSAKLTMQHIRDSGYSIVVVSNLPLSETDRAALLPLCATYIERPNFGYDFGAFRDGVLYVTEQRKDLQRLALLNDSTWYPLPDRYNWLLKAEEMGHDLVGAVSNYGTPRVGVEDFAEFEWTYSTDHRNFHYCSFALSFGPEIANNRRFRRFWARFAMDNNKKRVVRRGEIGLTQWVIAKGFTHECTCNPATLRDELAALDDDRLYQVAARAIFPEYPHGQAAKQAVLDTPRSDPGWRKLLTNYLLMAATSQGTSYALAELTTQEMSFPFLKKSPLRLSKSGSDISLDIISRIPGEMGQCIMQEALVLKESRTTKYDALENPKYKEKKKGR